jgi:hypothetical protein
MSLYCPFGNASKQEAFSLHTKTQGTKMKSAPFLQPVTPRDPKKRIDKWFVTTHGTHWSVAASVTVVILGSYLIYSIRNINSTIATTTPAVHMAPTRSMPLVLEK